MTPTNRTPTARKVHATLDDHETRLRLVESYRESDGEKLDGISADMRQLRAAFDELSRDVRNVLMHERDTAAESIRKKPQSGFVMAQVRKSLAASVAVIIAALAGGAAAVAQSCGHQAQIGHPYPAVSAQK